MMRAVRFEQRFRFRIEDRTLQLINEARELVHQVSGDRLRHELNLTLAEERAVSMLNRLQSLRLLSAIHPVLAWSEAFQPLLDKALNETVPPEWNLPEKLGNIPLHQALGYLAWLSQIPLDDTLSIAQRLRLPNDLQEAFVAVQKLVKDLPGLVNTAPSQVVLRLVEVPVISLYLTSLLPLNPAEQQIIQQYQSNWRKIWPATNGDDLRKMGVEPGPMYRQILGGLRAAWLDEKISTIDEEIQFLQELLQHLVK
jgi:tRNA nucleotidyltransferase (CCA-adding enzyme)